MGIALQTMTNELTHVFLLSVGAFLLAMFLTPIYTFFAYRYRFWKRQRSESTDGKKLKIFAKFQAAKLRRNINFRQIPSGKIAAKHPDDGWSDWRNFNLCGDDFL